MTSRARLCVQQYRTPDYFAHLSRTIQQLKAEGLLCFVHCLRKLVLPVVLAAMSAKKQGTQ